jgi:enoyl-[acyl-carrier protein] reductase III
MTGATTDLTGRTVLVTGSSRGLGAATAVRLARCGADVVITHRRSPEQADAVADEVRRHGRRAWVHQVDLSDPDSVDGLFDAVAGNVDTLDALVLNAASTSFRSLMDAERRHLERTFAISVMGTLQCVQRAVPLMPQGGGHVVAVSGADTRTWIPGHGLLAAAKAAVESMVRYLACELGDRGITVVGVSPGWLDGDSLQQMLGPLYGFGMSLERETHPMRRAVTPAEAADVVALLCTEAARLLSGTTVEADGAGVFAFCGRYATVGARLAMADADGITEADLAAAPAVPTDDRS